MCVCVIDTVGEQAGQPPGDDVHHSCMSTARRTVCTDDDVVWSTARQPLSVWLTIIAPLSLLPSATRKCINVPFCFTRPESYFGTFSRHCTMVSSLCTIDIHTHPFNGFFSGTIQVSRYQKGKTNLDFTGARDSEWQWRQLGYMHVCTSLQTDNHASSPPLSSLQAGCPSCRPTNSVRALNALYHRHGIDRYLDT